MLFNYQKLQKNKIEYCTVKNMNFSDTLELLNIIFLTFILCVIRKLKICIIINYHQIYALLQSQYLAEYNEIIIR